MTIEKFAFSLRKTYIRVELSDIENIEKIVLLDKDYRTIDTGFDLMPKIIELLAGSEGEKEFRITLSDLEITRFSGLFVLYIQTVPGDEYRESILETSFYEKCVLDRLLSSNAIDNCLKGKDLSVINSFNLLHSLKSAEKLGAYDDAFLIEKALNSYCCGSCKECGNC